MASNYHCPTLSQPWYTWVSLFSAVWCVCWLELLPINSYLRWPTWFPFPKAGLGVSRSPLVLRMLGWLAVTVSLVLLCRCPLPMWTPPWLRLQLPRLQPKEVPSRCLPSRAAACYLPGRQRAVDSPLRSPMHHPSRSPPHLLSNCRSPCPCLLLCSPPNRWPRQGEGARQVPEGGV